MENKQIKSIKCDYCNNSTYNNRTCDNCFKELLKFPKEKLNKYKERVYHEKKEYLY